MPNCYVHARLAYRVIAYPFIPFGRNQCDPNSSIHLWTNNTTHQGLGLQTQPRFISCTNTTASPTIGPTNITFSNCWIELPQFHKNFLRIQSIGSYILHICPIITNIIIQIHYAYVALFLRPC